MGRRQQRVREQQARRDQEKLALSEMFRTAHWQRMRLHPVETAVVGSQTTHPRPEHIYYRCMVCGVMDRVFERSTGGQDFLAKHYHEGVQMKLPLTGVLA